MSGRELQQIDETNKIEKSSTIQDTQEVSAIQRQLTMEYSKGADVSGNNSRDAQHDGKILAYKYISKEYKQGKLSPEGGESVDIQNFIQIRNDLGKTFFDNMLYKYDIPYKEIFCLAEDLRTADAARLEQIKADLVTFLEEMHQDDGEAPQSDHQGESDVEEKVSVEYTPEQINTGVANLSELLGYNVSGLLGSPNTTEYQETKKRDKKIKGKVDELSPAEKTLMKEKLLPELGSVLLHLTHCVEDGDKYIGYDPNAVQKSGMNQEKIKELGKKLGVIGEYLGINNTDLRKQAGTLLIARLESNGKSLTQSQKEELLGTPSIPKKVDAFVFADLLTAPDNEGKTHKSLREWQLRNAEGFAATVKQKGMSILGKKLDTESEKNLSLGFMGQFNDLLNIRLDAFLLGNRSISTLQLATLETEVKGAVNDALSAFFNDLNAMQVKNGDVLSACTSLSQTQEFSSPDNAYQFVKDNFSKSSAERQKVLLTSKTNAAPLTTKADHDALTTSLNSVISKIEGKLVNPTDQEKFTHEATKMLSGIGEMGRDVIDRLKSEPVQELIKVFQELFGVLDMGTSFFDNLLKLNVLKESNLSPIALKAIVEGEKLLDAASFKNIPLLEDGKPDMNRLGKKIKDDKKLFDVAHFGASRSNESQDTWSCVTKQSLGPDMYATLFKKFKEGNPGFAGEPDLLDVAMRNMCTQNKTPNIYATFYATRARGKSTDSYTLFMNQFDLMVGRFTDDTKGEARTKTKSPNEVAVKGILATLLDGREGAIGVVKGSSNEVAQQVEGAKDVAEVKTLTEKVTMQVDGDNKLTLDNIPAGTTLGIKVGDKEPTPYTGALPVIDLGNPPVFTLVKQESPGVWSSSVKIDAIRVAQPTKTEIASNKSKVTLTGLPVTTYQTRVQYTNASNQTELVAGNECTPATVEAPVDCTLDTQKGTAKAINIKPKTGGLRQTVWKSE